MCFIRQSEICGSMDIAQKLNEALSAIDWGFIQTQAANFATNLANGLNGFVSGLDWNLIGTTIGIGAPVPPFLLPLLKNLKSQVEEVASTEEKEEE